MFPPDKRMIWREMLNPMPLPFSLVVKKGMKICSAMSGGDGRAVVGYFNQHGFGFVAIGAYVDVLFVRCGRRHFKGLYGVLQ